MVVEIVIVGIGAALTLGRIVWELKTGRVPEPEDDGSGQW